VATPGPTLNVVGRTENLAAGPPRGREPSGRVVSGSSGLTPGPLGEAARMSAEGRAEPDQSGHRSKEPMPPPTTPAPANTVPTAASAAAALTAPVTFVLDMSAIVAPLRAVRAPLKPSLSFNVGLRADDNHP
jgi:hypothetical protein